MGDHYMGQKPTQALSQGRAPLIGLEDGWLQPSTKTGSGRILAGAPSKWESSTRNRIMLWSYSSPPEIAY